MFRINKRCNFIFESQKVVSAYLHLALQSSITEPSLGCGPGWTESVSHVSATIIYFLEAYLVCSHDHLSVDRVINIVIHYISHLSRESAFN